MGNPKTILGNFSRSSFAILKKTYCKSNATQAAKSFFYLSLRVFSLLFIYMALDRAIMRTALLGQDQYAHPFIFPEIFRNSVGKPLLIFLPLFGVLIWRKALWISWKSFEMEKVLRWFITLVSLILAWAFSTYDFNFYFNHSHLVDRILLLVLVAGVFWKPIFVFPFVLLSLALMWQFNYPFGPYSLTQQILLIHILVLFLGMIVLSAVLRRQKIDDFVFIALTMVASSYWWPGIGKVQLNWVSLGHIYQLLFATYSKGWLAFLDPSSIESLGKFFSWLDWPMRIMTLTVEVGHFLPLWRRNGLRVFLGAWILFHFGIFMMTGICFWYWIILDAILLILLLKNTHFKSLPIFTKEHFFISLLLIVGCKFWLKPINLAWYDTRISYSPRFEVIGESGAPYALAPYFFSPFEYQFTMDNFLYLGKEKRLPVIWGTTKDFSLAKALLETSTKQEIFDLESSMGILHFNATRVAGFDDFLKIFFGNLNTRGSKKTWLSMIKAPPQLWTFPRGEAYQFQEKIVKVRVYQITSLFDGKRYSEIRNQLLHETDIP